MTSAQPRTSVSFNRTVLQLPQPTTTRRLHYVRCPVLVHEFPNRTLGVSYQGRLLATYNLQGDLLTGTKTKKKAA